MHRAVFSSPPACDAAARVKLLINGGNVCTARARIFTLYNEGSALSGCRGQRAARVVVQP